MKESKLRRAGMILGAALALHALGSQSATAAQGGVFGLRGAGKLTCAQFTEAYKAQDERTIYLAAGWIDGYVTALNERIDGVVQLLPWQTTELVLEAVHGRCVTAPDEPFSEAVAGFVQFAAPTRLTERSDPTRIPLPDGGQLEIHKDTLAKAQEQLAALGHYTSTVDGAYGPGTAAAFRAFQAASGLQETGLPDQITLWTLFSPLYQNRG